MKALLLLLFAAALPLFANPASDACALLKDQKKEEAFRLFLKALEKPAAETAGVALSPSYIEALAIYLNPESSASDSAEKILSAFQEKEGVDYLLAVAYANKGNFEQFFTFFWKGYEKQPEHFLAYKARAVLHIKLMEGAPTPEARALHMKEIVSLSKQALKLESKDHSLYRFVIAFSPDEEKGETLNTYLNEIINNNIITPRADIKFYVQQAVKAKKYELAERYLTKAGEWYPFSRAINSAKDYLDQEKRA